VDHLRPALDHDVLAIRDFAQPEEVLALRAAFNAAIAAHQAGNTSLRVRKWSARTEVPAKGIMQVLGQSQSRIISTMRSRMVSMTRDSFAAPDILPEWTLFTQMRVGDSIALHADAERQTSDGWEVNHTPWRTHVGLLYLNSAGVDLQGGNLVLPEINRTIFPSSGLFVAFPSGRKHLHQVTTIESGSRLSFIVWFTRDANRLEGGWPS